MARCAANLSSPDCRVAGDVAVPQVCLGLCCLSKCACAGTSTIVQCCSLGSSWWLFICGNGQGSSLFHVKLRILTTQATVLARYV